MDNFSPWAEFFNFYDAAGSVLDSKHYIHPWNCKLRIPAEHVVYTNCCFWFCFDIQNNFGTQYVLQMLQPSGKDLPVPHLLINSISNQMDAIIQSEAYFLRFPMCRVVAITLLILSSKNSDIAFCPSDNSDVKNSNSRTDLS